MLLRSLVGGLLVSISWICAFRVLCFCPCHRLDVFAGVTGSLTILFFSLFVTQPRRVWERTSNTITGPLHSTLFSVEVSPHSAPFCLSVFDPSLTQSFFPPSVSLFLFPFPFLPPPRCALIVVAMYPAEDVLGDLGVRQAMRSIPKNTRL